MGGLILGVARLTALLTSLVVLTFSSLAQAEESVCQTLANSVYNYLEIDKRGNLNEDLYEYFLTEASREDIRNSKFGDSVSLSINHERDGKFWANMSDDGVTKFRKNLTAIRSRRLSDPQMYAILTAVPIPEISEKALQCSVLAEAGGLFLALTH